MIRTVYTKTKGERGARRRHGGKAGNVYLPLRRQK